MISENKQEENKEEVIIKKFHNDVSKEINLNYIQNINKEIIHNKEDQNKEMKLKKTVQNNKYN